MSPWETIRPRSQRAVQFYRAVEFCARVRLSEMSSGEKSTQDLISELAAEEHRTQDLVEAAAKDAAEAAAEARAAATAARSLKPNPIRAWASLLGVLLSMGGIFWKVSTVAAVQAAQGRALLRKPGTSPC